MVINGITEIIEDDNIVMFQTNYGFHASSKYCSDNYWLICTIEN